MEGRRGLTNLTYLPTPSTLLFISDLQKLTSRHTSDSKPLQHTGLHGTRGDNDLSENIDERPSNVWQRRAADMLDDEKESLEDKEWRYTAWSKWSNCSKSTCKQRRTRLCTRSTLDHVIGDHVTRGDTSSSAPPPPPARNGSSSSCPEMISERRTCFLSTGKACSPRLFIEQVCLH